MEQTAKRSDKGIEPLKKLAETDICSAYGRTGVGGRKENQDSLTGTNVGENVVLTVCDGMGGMTGGQTASRIAITEIQQSMMETPDEEWNEIGVAKALNNANAAISKKSGAEPRLRGMGTTATLLILTKEAAYLTHVGDSRIYQIRNGKKIFRTFDHSKVFEMVAQNMMTEEQARLSSFSNIITRALGIRPNVVFSVEKIPYKKGDRFVLCCDGIWNCMPEEELISFLSAEETPGKTASLIAETVNYLGFENGGEHDNLTVIVADMNCDSQYQYSFFRPIQEMVKKIVPSKKGNQQLPK